MSISEPPKTGNSGFDRWLFLFWKLVNAGSATTVVTDNTVRPVTLGGTGKSSLTGYLKGNGTSAFTAVTTIPYSDISGTPIPESLNAQVTALSNTSTTGLYAITAFGSSATRTLTGTASRLTVTNGDGVSGNPTADISTSYAGQATIVTLGTITTGVWNAGAVTSSTTVTATTQLVSSVVTGTAPLSVASTTRVANLNVATAGTADAVTTNANLTGDVTSVGNAATVVKINGTLMSGLATGILKNTTTTGVPSIAVAGDFPTLNQSTTGNATTATNLAGGSGGAVPYQSAAGTTAMLANGTAGQVLQSNGTTLAPSWTAAGADDMVLASTQTVTGAKTFGSAGAVGKLIIAGATSGSTILDATAVAGTGTVTLPTTGTLATLAGTETITNKTFADTLLELRKDQAAQTSFKVNNANASGSTALLLNTDTITGNGVGFFLRGSTGGTYQALVPNAFVLYTSNAAGIAFDVDANGPIGFWANAAERFRIQAAAVTAYVPIALKGYTVATLPAGVQGYKAFVTDALGPTYLVTVVGGGAVVTEVFYNGTNWVCT